MQFTFFLSFSALSQLSAASYGCVFAHVARIVPMALAAVVVIVVAGPFDMYQRSQRRSPMCVLMRRPWLWYRKQRARDASVRIACMFFLLGADGIYWPFTTELWASIAVWFMSSSLRTSAGDPPCSFTTLL